MTAAEFLDELDAAHADRFRNRAAYDHYTASVSRALPKLTAAVRAVLALCESAERDVSELLGLRAGLRIASNVSSDDIRAVLADALAGDA